MAMVGKKKKLNLDVAKYFCLVAHGAALEFRDARWQISSVSLPQILYFCF
jgi:hypothetical protein